MAREKIMSEVITLIEIHGIEPERADRIKGHIFSLFKFPIGFTVIGKVFIAEHPLVSMEDWDGNKQPFLRISSKNEEMVDLVHEKLRPLGIAIL